MSRRERELEILTEPSMDEREDRRMETIWKKFCKEAGVEYEHPPGIHKTYGYPSLVEHETRSARKARWTRMDNACSASDFKGVEDSIRIKCRDMIIPYHRPPPNESREERKKRIHKMQYSAKLARDRKKRQDMTPEELERQREKERIRKRVSRANAKLKLEEKLLKEKHAGEIVTNYIAKKEMIKSTYIERKKHGWDMGNANCGNPYCKCLCSIEKELDGTLRQGFFWQWNIPRSK